jgi:two-component system, OmpR family, response regulator ResD
VSELLVVDDDHALQRMIRLTLEKEGHAVRTAPDAETGLAELRRKLPDLALLDVRLPGMSGFDLCRKIKEDAALKSLPIIFLTSKGEEPHRVAGLEMGADDYIVKPFSAPELLARIKTVLRRTRGGDAPAAEALTAGPLRLDRSERLASVAGKKLALTAKEFDLLSLLLSRKRKVLGRPLISDEVWEQEYTGTSRTIDTHVNSLRRKLGTLGKCIETVENAGYRWMDPED